MRVTDDDFVEPRYSTCPNGHPSDKAGNCMAAGCQYNLSGG